MANASSTGFGFQSVMTLGNTPATQGLSEYVLKSGTAKRINQNDPCSKQGTGGDDGYIQDAAHTTMADGVTGGAGWANNTGTIQAITGVFNGAFYVNSTTSKPTWANTIVESTTFGTDYNTGSSDGTAFVLDNPNQEFNIRVGGSAWQQNDVGLNYNTGDNGATGISGMSDERLRISSVASTSMFTLVRGANIQGQNDYASDGSDVVVVIAKGSHLYN